jgi:hypothetical protein
VLGNDLGEMFRNQERNLEERGISIVYAVFERPIVRHFSRTIPNKTLLKDPELLQAFSEGSLMTTARISAVRRRLCERIGLENDASRDFQEAFLLLFTARCWEHSGMIK